MVLGLYNGNKSKCFPLWFTTLYSTVKFRIFRIGLDNSETAWIIELTAFDTTIPTYIPNSLNLLKHLHETCSWTPNFQFLAKSLPISIKATTKIFVSCVALKSYKSWVNFKKIQTIRAQPFTSGSQV